MRILIAALVAGLITGCSGGADQKAEIEDQQVRTGLPCATAIGVVEAPGPYYRVHGTGGGFIALPAGEMQLERRGPEGSGYEEYRFSKFGLHVRRFRQVSLEIVGAPDDAVLRYGGAPADALTVGPCDTDGDECVIEPTEHLSVGPCGTDRGEWVVWAGGVWVNEPGCVELGASSDGESVPVQLAVGAACEAAS